MTVTKFVLAVLIALTSWDVVTTYYGAISVFVGFSTDVGSNLASATIAQHVTSLLIAITLITIVLCYKIILQNKNIITTSILYTGFAIDFLTSLYGTASATISLGAQGEILQWGLVIFLSIASTAGPILIHQVVSGTGGEY